MMKNPKVHSLYHGKSVCQRAAHTFRGHPTSKTGYYVIWKGAFCIQTCESVGHVPPEPPVPTHMSVRNHSWLLRQIEENQGRNFNKLQGVYQRLPYEKFFGSDFFLVPVVDQWSWVQLVASQKYIVLPFLPLRNGKTFKARGLLTPNTPISFVPKKKGA